MSHQGQHIIENRRRAENAMRDIEVVLSEHQKVKQIANFELKTAKKIELNMKKAELEKRKQGYLQDVLDRRRRLAHLYNSEMEGWRDEVLSKVETQEDRKARIMERAYALREHRENERHRYVQQKLDLQWRDANDDARTLDSKAMTIYMNNQRLQQIQEKKERKERLSSQENSFLDAWNAQLDAIEKQQRDKTENRRRIDKETSEQIKQQMIENARRKEETHKKELEADHNELAALRDAIEAEENLQRKRREEAYSRGKDVLEFNQSTRIYREEAARVEQEQNQILLNYALQKEAAANQMEAAKSQEARESALKYRKYLEDLMVREAEDTAFVDEVRKREEERVWKARDDALQARQDARDYLMREVDAGRQEQIRARQQLSEQEKLEGQKFASKFLDEAAEAMRRDREEQERRRGQNVQNKTKLQSQIDYRRYKEELEKQEEYLANKQMEHMERMHKQRLESQGGAVRDFRPLKKNNWYT